MRHVVVTRGKLIVGALRVNTEFAPDGQCGGRGCAHGSLGADATSPSCGKNAVMFDVIGRLRRRQAVMGIVVDGNGLPRQHDVVGVITKEHIADEVATA